jgi:dolichol-phosphate mannosyltransferase
MDSDLQDRPDVINELYKKANEGFDVVFVSRKNRPEALWYLLTQKIFYRFLNLTSGLKFNSSQANFSIINFRVVEAFKSFNEKTRFYGSTIKWLGFETTDIKADHGIRFKGEPSYTFKKRIKLAADIILAFSDRPLKLAIVLSITWSFICLAFGSVYFLAGFNKESLENYLNFYRFFIILTAGIILSSIGLFGIYLMSIFQEVKKRPLYIISQEIN